MAADAHTPPMGLPDFSPLFCGAPLYAERIPVSRGKIRVTMSHDLRSTGEHDCVSLVRERAHHPAVQYADRSVLRLRFGRTGTGRLGHSDIRGVASQRSGGR
jgi:hypothetical protein